MSARLLGALPSSADVSFIEPAVRDGALRQGGVRRAAMAIALG